MLRFLILTVLASGFTLGCLAQVSAATPSLAEQIKAYRWKKRVVVLYAPMAESAELKQQKARMAAAAAQVQARDIIIVEAIETSLTAADKQYVRQTLGVAPGSFAVFLIGKDGGVKRKASKPLDPNELFQTIDTMPMRRQEMRTQDK